MEPAIVVERYDTCHACGEKRSIECYNSYNNKPMGYSLLLDALQNGGFNQALVDRFLNKGEISSMKCKKCGKEYMIFHMNNGMIKPLTNDDYMNLFLLHFYNNNN